MKKNPYRQVEHALRVAGKVLLCLVWTVIIGVPVSFVIAFVWTQGGWGARALTLPIIFVVGIFAPHVPLRAHLVAVRHDEERLAKAPRRLGSCPGSHPLRERFLNDLTVAHNVAILTA